MAENRNIEQLSFCPGLWNHFAEALRLVFVALLIPAIFSDYPKVPSPYGSIYRNRVRHFSIKTQQMFAALTIRFLTTSVAMCVHLA